MTSLKPHCPNCKEIQVDPEDDYAELEKNRVVCYYCGEERSKGTEVYPFSKQQKRFVKKLIGYLEKVSASNQLWDKANNIVIRKGYVHKNTDALYSIPTLIEALKEMVEDFDTYTEGVRRIYQSLKEDYTDSKLIEHVVNDE